jgi:drug/metabolite transporter (DMT)-like permease
MNRRTKAHLAVLGANFIFGANFSVVKYITPSAIQPLALNVVRILVTTILFWVFFAFKPGKMEVNRKDVTRFIVCGAAGVALNQLMFIKGLSLTTSIHAALLMLATPIIITFIAAWLLKERLDKIKFIGLALGIGGAINLIIQKDSLQSASDIIRGDIFVLLNAILYGFYLVMVRPLMEKYTALQVIRWIFTIGLFIILPIGWNEFTATNWQAIEPGHWTAIAFVVFGATFFSYLFNIYGVSVLGASATGAYIYTQPVFAAVIAMIFMGEEFTLSKALSALLIFAGVYLANFRSVKIGAIEE